MSSAPLLGKVGDSGGSEGGEIENAQVENRSRAVLCFGSGKYDEHGDALSDSSRDETDGFGCGGTAGCCRKKQVAKASLFVGMGLMLLIIALPSLALSARGSGWVKGRSRSGGAIEAGWEKGNVTGYEFVEFGGRGNSTVVWNPCDTCEGVSLDGAGDIAGQWGKLGHVLPMLFVFALVFPLSLCIWVPSCCRASFKVMFGDEARSAWWTEACVLLFWMLTQGLWFGFGVAMIVVAVSFVRGVEDGVSAASRRAVDVVCDGNVVCDSVRSRVECAICEFNADVVTCKGVASSCSLIEVVVGCGSPEAMCGSTASWAFVVAVMCGCVFVLAAVGMGFVMWGLLGVREQEGNSEDEEEGGGES